MQTATVLTAAVSLRVRDSGNLFHTAAIVRSVLTDAQRMVNARLGQGQGHIVETAALAIAANTNLAAIFANAANAMRIEGVREGTRGLVRMPWRELLQLGLTVRGDSFEVFSIVGRDLLALWPAKRAASSVTLVYTKLTAVFAAGATSSELDDESLPDVLTLAEIALLLRQRDMQDAKGLLEGLS